MIAGGIAGGDSNTNWTLTRSLVIGTINGITVNKELAPYISYRKVDVPTSIQDVQLKDVYTEGKSSYDLLGRKVINAPSGTIRIINGKKVLQK